ncbi:hypothetical protein ABLE91_24280 [Aquabacter sp. CN5-332]|uniref:hypothetical protein n=1 Tax=Aquabacter sp. CN5-332 TaxID=3156608 RepID=UPI0032B50B77
MLHSHLPDPDMVGATVRSPAEHRAIVAKAGTSDRAVLAWPTAERLSRLDVTGLAALVKWRDLMEPPRPMLVLDPADDSMAPRAYRKERPTVEEMLKAAGSLWRVTVRRHGPGLWGRPVRHPVQHGVAGSTVWLGELVFRAGELVAWGLDDRGEPLTPHEPISRPRRGAGPSVRQRVAVESDDAEPPRSNEGELLEHEHPAEADAWRLIEARSIREAIGPTHAKVLDLAISSITARGIGEEFGCRGKHAERKGGQLIHDAISALRGIWELPEAANDNVLEDDLKIAA